MAFAISSDSGILIEPGERPSVDMTPRLLLALTALYAQRPTHTTEEQQQYSELALRLIDKVEAATRTAVAGILQRHPDAPAEVVERLGGGRSSHDDDAKGGPHSTPDQHCADIQRFERIFGSVDVAALYGWIGEFTREFERLIDIPRSLCERILNDPSGEPMVVAAKAAGMPIAILQRILLVSPAASHSVERVYDLTELYHDLDARVARDLLGEWRAQAKSGDPVPEMEPDTGDCRPGAPRPLPYPPPLAGEGRVGVSVRSRFSALTERVRNQAVNARCDRGSAAQRGLQSR